MVVPVVVESYHASRHYWAVDRCPEQTFLRRAPSAVTGDWEASVRCISWSWELGAAWSARSSQWSVVQRYWQLQPEEQREGGDERQRAPLVVQYSAPIRCSSVCE